MIKSKAEGYGSSDNAIDYWVSHRSKLSDLYKSERHFLDTILENSKSVLDIGCAAGGSALFTREINPKIAYYGIDISSEMIKRASARLENMPNTKFMHFDGANIPMADNSVESLFSFGVFHHVPDWQTYAQEALRVSQKYVLFDIRTWCNPSLKNSPDSYQKLALGGDWDGESTIAYNIIAMNEFFSFLQALKSKSIGSRVFGYNGKPTELAVTPAKEVTMLAVLLEKNVLNADIKLELA